MATPKRPSDRGIAQVVALVREALIEKKMTQAELADAADCHEKTIQNLLAGKPVRPQTLFDVAMVLGLDYPALRHLWSGGGPVASPETPRGEAPEAAGAGGDIAPVYMGAYTQAGVDHYLGSYLTLRPAFSEPGKIVAYRTDITWDADWPSLLFEERDRPDAPYAHRGRLYIPTSSPFVHLVSLTKGAMRMIIVSQIDQEGAMRGLVTTLNKRGPRFVPVAAPIVYRKLGTFDGVALGEIGRTHAQHASYAQALGQAVALGYAALVPVAAVE
jgi:transcriptional regulator with XRE-family HTH domain